MYPARFEYHAPASVEEALEILERYGDEGKVLAGGQSLIPLMKLRFASPRALVDINRIEGLDSIGEDNGFLSIGALVRHKDCERPKCSAARYGVLADAAPQISDPIVRNRGTVVGSLTTPIRRETGARRLLPPGHVSRSSPRAARARSRSTSSSRPVHDQPGAERDRHGRAGSRPGRARAARISSSSARSATSPPSASPSTSPWTTGRSGAPGSR